MASEAKGLLWVPIWVDDGVVKALVLDTGALPVTETDPITEVTATLAATTITLKVAEQTPLTSIQAQAYGYIDSSWQKQAMLWGYTDRLAERLTHTKVGAGTYNMDFTAVPAGYVFVVTAISSYNSATQVSQEFMLRINAVSYPCYPYKTPAANAWNVTEPMHLTLKADDKVRITFRACVDSDILIGIIFGYKMKVDM
jgi:hypothetical protein